MTELNIKLQQNYEVEYVVNYFTKLSKNIREDIISAFNLFASLNNDPQVIEEYSHAAYVMCRYMSPASEDVISLLLWLPYSKGMCGQLRFKETFSEKRYEHYFKQTASVIQNTPRNDPLDIKKARDYYVFMRVCDKMLKTLTNTMERNGIPDVYCVWRAYNFARKAHYGVMRTSGEPYMTHPIAVATILANLGVESNIIAAALLHDVVEDTDITHQDLINEFGLEIAEMVDGVTKLSKLNYESIEEAQVENYRKMFLAMGKDIRVIMIKLADRLHNMRTLKFLSRDRQIANAKETMELYAPLANRLRYIFIKMGIRRFRI